MVKLEALIEIVRRGDKEDDPLEQRLAIVSNYKYIENGSIVFHFPTILVAKTLMGFTPMFDVFICMQKKVDLTIKLKQWEMQKMFPQ